MSRTNIWREMKKLCVQENVNPSKVFPHNLRHLFARTFYGIEKDITKLADIEKQVQELFDRLMRQRTERGGITEKLKADNQIKWVGRMNALRSAVMKTVNNEVIFV